MDGQTDRQRLHDGKNSEFNRSVKNVVEDNINDINADAADNDKIKILTVIWSVVLLLIFFKQNSPLILTLLLSLSRCCQQTSKQSYIQCIGASDQRICCL